MLEQKMSVWSSNIKKPFENEASSTIIAPIAQDVVTNRYICNKCESLYATKETLKIHTKGHDPEKKYKCDHCNYEGNQRTILVSHIRSKHKNLWFHCDQCEFKTSQRSNLNVHIQKNARRNCFWLQSMRV